VLADVINSNFTNLCQIIFSFLVSLNYFLVPAFIGWMFMFPILRRNEKIDFLPLLFVVSWISGSLFLLVVLLLLLLLNIYHQMIFVQVTLIMLFLKIFASFSFCRKEVKIEKAVFIKYIGALFASLLPLLIFKFLTGFPGNYSSLGYRFTYISESMVQRSEVIIDQLTNYAPLSQIILSILSTIYRVDSYSLSWFIPLFIQVLFFNGIYIYISMYLPTDDLAFFGAMLSSYVLVWDPNYFTPPIHDLQPRVLTLVMFPYLLSALIYSQKTTRETKKYLINLILIFLVSLFIFFAMHSMMHPEILDRKLMIFPAMLSLLFSVFIGFINKDNGLVWFAVSILMTAFPIEHIFEGAFYIVFAFCFGLLLIFSEKFPKLFKRVTSIIAFILPFILYGLINGFLKLHQIPMFIETPNYYEYEYHPDFYYNVLLNALSPIVSYVMILGIVIALINKRAKNYLWETSLLTTFLIMIIYFMPIPDIVRVSAALAPFVSLYVTFSIRGIVYFISQKVFTRLKLSLFYHIHLVKSLLSISLMALILFSATTPFLNYISSKLFYPEGFTNFSLSLVADYEYDIGLWIRNNVAKDAVVISDPETMYIVAGISGRKLPIAIGMLIQDLQISDLIKLYWIKFNIINGTDPIKAAFYAKSLGKYPIIIISCRTIKWLNNLQFVPYPCYLNISSNPVVKKFLNASNVFRLLYKVEDKAYVFTLQNDSFNFPEYNYKVYLLNNASQYSNITTFSNDWRNSSQQWYLQRRVVKGKVTTLDYEQFISNGGNPPVIKWTIPVSCNAIWVDVYLYNFHPLNSDKDSWFLLSSDGNNWVQGNFAYPLQYAMRVTVQDHFITLYGKSVKGKFTRIGAFIIIEWCPKN
jgi:hypothetical protein